MHFDPAVRAEYNREYRARPEVRERDNRNARLRYENGGKAAKAEYDKLNRQRPDVREQRRQYCAARRIKHWGKQKAAELKLRARNLGVPFDLVPGDLVVPATCPVLGIPLSFGVRKQHLASPSVDRVVPSKGYVRGNIVVISLRANILKNNATIDELEKLVSFYRSFNKGDDS